MAQERFWNWKDNDSTFRLNWRDLLIIPYGIYAGFDAYLNNGMELSLKHLTDDKTKIKDDLTESNPMGVWKSKQGVVITEDIPVTIPIQQGDSEDRIDLIVGEHEYVYSVGGAAAQYKVIKGTPATNPTSPNLTEPHKQVILGELFVPKNTTQLSDSGVKYTKAETPTLGNKEGTMYLNEKQKSTALKEFNVQKGVTVISSLDPNSDKINTSTESNFYVLESSSSSFADRYHEINGFTDDLLGSGQMIHFFTTHGLKLVDSYSGGGNLLIQDEEMYIEPYSYFSVLDVSNTFNNKKVYSLAKGGEMTPTRANKANSTQVQGKDSNAVTPNQQGFIFTGYKGNYLEVDATTNSDINGIRSYAFLAQNPNNTSIEEAGGHITMTFTNGVKLKHDSQALAGFNKPLWLITEKDLNILPDTTCVFIEDFNHWRLVSISSKKSIFGFNDLKNDVNPNQKDILYFNGYKWVSIPRSSNYYYDNIADLKTDSYELELGGNTFYTHRIKSKGLIDTNLQQSAIAHKMIGFETDDTLNSRGDIIRLRVIGESFTITVNKTSNIPITLPKLIYKKGVAADTDIVLSQGVYTFMLCEQPDAQYYPAGWELISEP